jgi:KDO2-lipid IV(A) lauroyltransferase
MKPRTRRKLRLLRRPLEWLGVALGFAVFSFLTRRGLLRICDFVSAVMYFFDRRGRRDAMENLRVMYGRLPRNADRIVRRSYRNMARTVGYAFWTCFRAKKRAMASGEMCEAGKAFLAANKPAVTVSGHIGCWEILSQLAFLEGHSMMSVAKDIGSKGMTNLLMRARKSIGQEIVHADGAFKALMAGIRGGKSLGLLVDQPVDPREGGIWVRFFGRPVPVSAAPAFFAAKGKAPIVTAWSRPLKDGRWRCDTIATYPPEAARDVWAMTQRCIKDLESVIRRHPSCWVLNYRYFRKERKFGDAERAQLESREAKLRM